MVTNNIPDHLLPEVQELLKLDKWKRAEYIKKDIWISYSTALKALIKLKELFDHPQRQRMPNLLIIGPTNNGKSMIIEKFCRSYQSKIERRNVPWDKFYDLGEQDFLVEMPIVSVQMPPVPDAKRFYLAISQKLESQCVGSSHSGLHTSYLEAHILLLLRKYKVKMLIIDEMNMKSQR
jgi:hypothetical protein